MRLSELVSSMDLSLYPQIALVIFLLIFAGVIHRTVTKTRTEEYTKAANLPLDSKE